MSSLAAVSRRPKVASSGIGTALLAGFAVVFALWLVWGYLLARAFQEIERGTSSVHASYVRGEQALARVRTNVLLSSIYLRDALIDAATPRREASRLKLAGLRDEIEQILRTYLPAVTSAVEREHWARLQVELTDYWASREIVLTESGVRGPEAGELLRRGVVPSREMVLAILDQIASMQAAGNARHQAGARANYDAVARRLTVVGVGTMVLAVAVAILASRHVRRLETHIDAQRLNEQQSREELERLSASLVDVQEKERQNLARELHDEVGQALTALKIDLGVALRSDLGPAARSALLEAREIAETTLRNVRDLSQLLHPSMLDDFGLPATVSAYLRSYTERTGIRAKLAETLEERLTPELEVCVYRIVQEALSNVARHSGATACTVSLGVGDGALRLVIEDNGHGIDAGAAGRPRRGLGIIGMRERAQSFGGEFSLERGTAGGTRVVASLPLGPVHSPAIEPVRKVV
jgi:signal transduction histidine kinase